MRVITEHEKCKKEQSGTKYRDTLIQVPPSSEFQVPPSSAKFRQVPSSKFIIIILDFIQFYSTSTEFYRIYPS